jgi:mannitol/fructose-specific phosphotransferase system IIA component (Ntr-type)
MKLGEILLNKNLLTPEQLDSLLQQQQQAQKKLGELLLEAGLIAPETLKMALKEQYWRRNGFWVIK